MSIPFKNIASIEKDRNGSIVVLQSGREFFLRGTNDVNDDNDGILVSIADLGTVDIPWRAFEKVTFYEVPASGYSYDDYRVPQGLSGTVRTYDDDEFSGRLIYDVDEASEIETLDGEDDDVKIQNSFCPYQKDHSEEL